MKHSADRVLTTHVGSLPRPADLHAMSVARREGQKVDDEAYAAQVRQAVSDIVRKQASLGVDIVDDGEMSKPSFITYINERLAGFEPDTAHRSQSPWAGSREVKEFPEFYAPQLANVHTKHAHYLCTGPVKYRGGQALKTDLDNLKAALKGVDVTDAFVPSTSVSSIEDWNRNVHYKSDEDYLFGLAEAMGEEYRAIVDAGFVLQVDDPQRLCGPHHPRPRRPGRHDLVVDDPIVQRGSLQPGLGHRATSQPSSSSSVFWNARSDSGVAVRRGSSGAVGGPTQAVQRSGVAV